MSDQGPKTPDVTRSTTLDSVIGSVEVDGIMRTRRQLIGDLALQLASDGAVADALEGASEGLVQTNTWAQLNAIAGTRAGQPGRVLGTDAGTHTDPVVGGTVANTGEFAWSVSPAGWKRLSALRVAEVTQAELDDEINNRTAADNTLQTNINAKAPLASPALTGNPTAPTPSPGDNDTSIATTGFVKAAVDVEAAARAGADASLDGRLDIVEPAVAALQGGAGNSVRHALAGRPGEVPNLFTASTAGGDEDAVAALNPALVADGDNGKAILITGAGYVQQRGFFAIEPGEAYNIRFALRRVLNTFDPSNDAVRLGVQLYDKSRALVTTLTLDTLTDLVVADGRQAFSYSIAKQIGAGVDAVVGSTVMYGKAFVWTFGTGSQTQVEIINVNQALPANALAIDAHGTLEGKAAYNAAAVGFVYLATDQSPWQFYIREGSAGTWKGPNTFEGTITPEQTALLASTQAVLATFQNQWLGMSATDPTAAPTGAALAEGMRYWNTVSHTERVYNSGAWQTVASLTAADASITPAKLATAMLVLLGGFLPVEAQARDSAKLGGIDAEKFITSVNKSKTIVQILSGSGTYTPPADCVGFTVRVVGGGGGGSGSSSASGTSGPNANILGTTGGDTTFGGLTAAGGVRGNFQGNAPAGGAVSGSIGIEVRRWAGGRGHAATGNSSTGNYQGGPGGGASGWGEPPPPFRGYGVNATSASANSGNGGGGAPGGGATPTYVGTGGAAGGYIEEYVPKAMMEDSYAYSVGAGGNKGLAGTDGFDGGDGGSGRITIEEYYL